MLSPMMTVVLLAVLWLIVVVPMLLKRKDDRAGERSVARFGGAMRALSHRRATPSVTRVMTPEGDGVAAEEPVAHGYRAQVFVPGGATRPEPVTRRPVPAAMEAVMYPERVERTDLSAARRQMMARRRRSLTLLAVGFLIGAGWVIASGSTISWLFAAVFTIGLGGYLSFLRNQALHDRDRREARMRRTVTRPAPSYDATDDVVYATESAAVVRIDDDDVALHGLADTVDLTGLYSDEEFDERPMRRAV